MEWPGVHAAKALVHGEPLEGYWFNRSKEWAARNRGIDFGRYDFATRYQVGFSPLPAFRHLSPEAYQDRIAELIREIETEGEQQRGGDAVAGIDKILSQNPYETPTRRPKRSSKPLSHSASKQVRIDLRQEYHEFLAQYREASVALRSGNLRAASWFPEGCYPPALAFVGPPAPRRPPSPPTRRIEASESGTVERGEIPLVAIDVRVDSLDVPRARGRPP